MFSRVQDILWCPALSLNLNFKSLEVSDKEFTFASRIHKNISRWR